MKKFRVKIADNEHIVEAENSDEAVVKALEENEKVNDGTIKEYGSFSFSSSEKRKAINFIKKNGKVSFDQLISIFRSSDLGEASVGALMRELENEGKVEWSPSGYTIKDSVINDSNIQDMIPQDIIKLANKYNFEIGQSDNNYIRFINGDYNKEGAFIKELEYNGYHIGSTGPGWVNINIKKSINKKDSTTIDAGNIYTVSFESDGISQTNEVRANSEQEAKQIFLEHYKKKGYKVDRIYGVRQGYENKPGMRVINDGLASIIQSSDFNDKNVIDAKIDDEKPEFIKSFAGYGIMFRVYKYSDGSMSVIPDGMTYGADYNEYKKRIEARYNDDMRALNAAFKFAGKI